MNGTSFNNKLAVLLICLIFAWWVFCVCIVAFCDIDLSRFEVFGLGLITGCLITAFTLIVQFYFRKRPSEGGSE
jgi:Na+-driven multidrug efflux pump